MGNDTSRVELLQGTPDLLILRTLVFGPSHGDAIPSRIRATSQDVLQVETGSLYPPSIGSRRRAGSSRSGSRRTRASGRSTTPSRQSDDNSWSSSSRSGSSSRWRWPAYSGSRSSEVTLRRLSYYLRALAGRRRVESELNEEIRSHLEQEAEAAASCTPASGSVFLRVQRP